MWDKHRCRNWQKVPRGKLRFDEHDGNESIKTLVIKIEAFQKLVKIAWTRKLHAPMHHASASSSAVQPRAA
jgi:hypothetical protein